MGDTSLATYLGMLTGIVGAITGTAGAIMGFVSYRRSNKIKSLDLRVQLRRAVADAAFDQKNLRDQIEEGNKSRMAVASAIGAFNSGMMKKWKQGVEIDQMAADGLASELPDENTQFDQYDLKGLEGKLIEVHKVHRKIQHLSEKYKQAMAWDDEQRRQVREDMRSRSKT